MATEYKLPFTGSEIAEKLTKVDDIDTHINNKNNPHGVTANIVGALPLSGGTMTGELRVNGRDKVGGSKIVLETGTGQITNSDTGTLFGYTDTARISVGHGSAVLAMRGSAARPQYNGNDLALKSDIPTVPTLTTETWTFTLEDGSTVKKAIYVGEVPVTLISFTIDGISYQAEGGMTWGEWCASSYNTDGCFAESSGSDYVFTNAGRWVIYPDGYGGRLGTCYTFATETIVADLAYRTE